MNTGRVMPSSSETLNKTGKCIRNPSYLGAIDDLADTADHSHCDIQAGVQKVLQIFITNAANVFLLQTDDSDMLMEQVIDNTSSQIMCANLYDYKFCVGL